MEIWDEWREDALKAGVAPDLAELGSDFIRHNQQHAWGFDTVEGFHLRLIELALEQPDAARAMWRNMIEGGAPGNGAA